MNTTNTIPVYLHIYAAEEQRWRELVETRGHRESDRDSELSVHPKDRALFARIDTVLTESDALAVQQ